MLFYSSAYHYSSIICYFTPPCTITPVFSYFTPLCTIIPVFYAILLLRVLLLQYSMLFYSSVYYYSSILCYFTPTCTITPVFHPYSHMNTHVTTNSSLTDCTPCKALLTHVTEKRRQSDKELCAQTANETSHNVVSIIQR
jgi:hypothetical protein